MANKEHVELITKGVGAWNAWRSEHSALRADFSEANLSGADLREVILSSGNLTRIDLRLANLERADLRRANLSDANLRLANLSEAFLSAAKLRRVNFNGAILQSSNLSGADLRKADLSGANLKYANLRNAILRSADLSSTDLTGADLGGADLSGANLTAAKLNRAELRGVELIETNLTDANLEGAYLGWATFGRNDLSSTKGLEQVFHIGPSTIGIDTLFNSDGKISEVFLRGVGVPDDFITFVPSLVGHAIEFYSCFISYSHQDEEFSRRLHSKMRSENLRVWYAPEDMKGGKKLHEEIFSAIQIHDKLLLVLSADSMKSEWVATEIRRARKVEREEQRRKLFPIRLVDFDDILTWECFDADSGKDLAVELREYYIPNFSNWKDHYAFEREFARLLRDLKATEE
jgi:uncharacterized protein YjbI with pentapeptide repeats